MISGLLLSTALIASAASPSVDSCGPDFVTGDSYGAYGNPNGVASVDVNDDGLLDLVFGTGDPNGAVGVRLGKPDGTFGPLIKRATLVGFLTWTVGTFHGGPIPDLVVSTFYGLRIFAGNGDGTFQDGVSIDGVLSMRILTTGDLNGDGKLDLIGVSNGAPNSLEVWLGNGDGTFLDPIETPTPEYFDALKAGQLDAGGTLDLVAVSGNTVAWVLLGLGDGHFQDAQPVTAGEGLISLELTDVNSDGKVDIVVPSGIDEVHTLLGNGDGTFGSPIVSGTVSYPTSLAAADFDGNGTMDLAVAGSGLTILLGAGDGTFSPRASYTAGRNPTGIVAARFGTDDRPDVAVGNGQTGRLEVLSGRGDGTLDAVRLSVTDPFSYAAAQGDFDEDGRLDVVVATINLLELMRGEGDGGFTPAAHVSVMDDQVDAMVAADLDQDGHLDLAVLLLHGTEIPVFLGRGDGTFAAGNSLFLPTSVYVNSALVEGDFDGDGRVDLAVVSSSFSDTSLIVFLGRPGGSFSPPIVGQLAHYSARVISGDWNEDGRDDLALLPGSVTDGISVLIGRGDGTFDSAVNYPVGAAPDALASGDLRNSGHQDLVAANLADQTITIWNGTGSGTFENARTLALGAQATAIAIGDFDGDGNRDVATANLDRTASVLFGLGTGAFDSPRAYPVAGQLYGALTGDYDRNGMEDLLLASQDYAGGLAVLLSSQLSARIDDLSTTVTTPAQWTARARGVGTLSYQWRRDGVPLTDGGSISGAQTSTLTIDPVAFADMAVYDVLVTDDCGSAGSNAAFLSVEFADVAASSPFHDDIITIASSGITSGCGGGNYCPTSPVRRDQMAVFLLRSEHGSSYAPPACTGVFADVPCPSAFADWVEQLAAEGVTSGCGGGNFCPGDSVSRAQMAVFLLKTSQGSSYTPPAATGIFGDVPAGSFAADFIEDLYGRGITGGCSASPLLYCPGSSVLRQQMATFLVRTFGF